VLLESRNWSRMTPRRVEDEDGRSRLEWTQQSGNEAILSFHRTVIIPSVDMSKKDEMIVGETGIYILFLRVHICLSPLAFGDETFEYPGVIIGQHDTAIADWRDGSLLMGRHWSDVELLTIGIPMTVASEIKFSILLQLVQLVQKS